MADNKNYYYLKLKDSFFESDEMLVLESMQDGYLYSNILLKLYLRSLKYDGRLMFNNRIPFNSTMLSQITRHSVGDIEKAIRVFEQLELIEVLDNGAIYMLDIQNFIGKSSDAGDRKRAQRNRIDQEKNFLLATGERQKGRQMSDIRLNDEREILDNTSFIDSDGQMSDKSTPEKEIELDIELEKEIDIKTEKNKPSIKELTDRFNSLWKEYPNKKGKENAFKSYQKAIKDNVTDETIKQGIEKYNQEIQFKRTDKQYIAHGSTWFGNRRWNDEYETGYIHQKTDYSIPKEYEHVIEELDKRESKYDLEDLPF